MEREVASRPRPAGGPGTGSRNTFSPYASKSVPGPDSPGELAELIHESACTVALTGAGISVPSGIPDFRSPGTGIWENVDPMEVAHIDAFLGDPARFWGFYRERLQMLGTKEPNDAHRVLADLERRGMLEAVVTQNIDTLHTQAGSRSVIEMHGTIRSHRCFECGAAYPLEELEPLFAPDGRAVCTACEGNVKPDVVLFGEMLPVGAMERAARLAERADLLLCIGSSLEVYPVAGLPEVTLGSGGKLAILTQGQTRFDGRAAVRLQGDVVAELSALQAAL